jgi:hypothetical protein
MRWKQRKYIGVVLGVGFSCVALTALIYWSIDRLPPTAVPYNYEKLQFTGVNPAMDADGNFTIYLSVNATGSRSLTTDKLFLNGILWSQLNDAISENLTGTKLRPGQRLTGTIRLKRGNTWQSGTTAIVMIKTVRGAQCSTVIILP